MEKNIKKNVHICIIESLCCTAESDMTERLPFHFSLSCIGEGNGSPLHVLAWRIPGTGEPGGLLSMGSHRVGHD